MKIPAIGTSKAIRAQEALDSFSSGYLDYQYQFVEFFVDNLGNLSRVFRGDLQLMLIVAILGQVRIRAVQAAVLGGMPAAEALQMTIGISASRLADVSAIPRQTVRRKLLALEERGWAEQSVDQTWYLMVAEGGASLRRELTGPVTRAMERIARLFVELEGIVGRAK